MGMSDSQFKFHLRQLLVQLEEAIEPDEKEEIVRKIEKIIILVKLGLEA